MIENDQSPLGRFKRRFELKELIFDGVVLLFATPLPGWLLPSGTLDRHMPTWLATQVALNVQMVMAMFIGWMAGRTIDEFDEKGGRRTIPGWRIWVTLAIIGLSLYSLFAVFFFFLAASLDRIGPLAVLGGIFVVVVGAMMGGSFGSYRVPATTEKTDSDEQFDGERVQSLSASNKSERDEMAATIAGTILILNVLLLVFRLGAAVSHRLGTGWLIAYLVLLLVIVGVLVNATDRYLLPVCKRWQGKSPGRFGEAFEIGFIILSAVAFMTMEHIYLTGKLLSGFEGRTGSVFVLLILAGLLPVRLLVSLAPPIKLANVPIGVLAIIVYMWSIV